MHELTFTSKAKLGCTAQEIDDIFKRSSHNNNASGITGCLIFYKNTFVQMLEGGRDELEFLFSKIKGDSRHHDIQLHWEGNSHKREFEHWTMAQTNYKQYAQHYETLQFERNLMLMAKLSKKSSACLQMFWRGVKNLLDQESSFHSNSMDSYAP